MLRFTPWIVYYRCRGRTRTPERTRTNSPSTPGTSSTSCRSRIPRIRYVTLTRSDPILPDPTPILPDPLRDAPTRSDPGRSYPTRSRPILPDPTRPDPDTNRTDPILPDPLRDDPTRPKTGLMVHLHCPTTRLRPRQIPIIGAQTQRESVQFCLCGLAHREFDIISYCLQNMLQTVVLNLLCLHKQYRLTIWQIIVTLAKK